MGVSGFMRPRERIPGARRFAISGKQLDPRVPGLREQPTVVDVHHEQIVREEGPPVLEEGGGQRRLPRPRRAEESQRPAIDDGCRRVERLHAHLQEGERQHLSEEVRPEGFAAGASGGQREDPAATRSHQELEEPRPSQVLRTIRQDAGSRTSPRDLERGRRAIGLLGTPKRRPDGYLRRRVPLLRPGVHPGATGIG